MVIGREIPPFYRNRSTKFITFLNKPKPPSSQCILALLATMQPTPGHVETKVVNLSAYDRVQEAKSNPKNSINHQILIIPQHETVSSNTHK